MPQHEPSRKAGNQTIVVAAASNGERAQPVLHVYLLGPFRFEQADGTALNVHAALGRPHCIILFKLLLCHPERRVSRTQLTEAIWPGQSYASIGGSLDTAKSVLKTRLHAVCGQTLMPRVNGDPPSFVLAGQQLLWTDIDACEQYMRQAVYTRDPEQALSLWEAAYTLLQRGVLLADDQDAYWYQTHLVQHRRQKLAKQRVQCALRVADLALEGGNLDRAVAVLSEESEVNPTNEEIALHLMELLAQHGRNTEALACYARLEATLLEQDAAPWQATRTLAQHLRSTETTRVSLDRHALFSSLQATERQIGRERETEALSPRSELPIPRQAPSLWTIPYPRNPFFTGREELLAYIHDQLHQTTTVAVTQTQAICGLGGIGKTQTAIEYAYRYHHEYETVFWINADIRESILADFIALARLLCLAERDAEDQMVVVNAVIQWLKTHTKWLLIFDNADDVAMIQPFLPPTFGGHILLTTRAQSPGRLARRIDVACMTPEVGALFLLRRAALVAADATLEQLPSAQLDRARMLVLQLDGLPLAIDQAGAYIEEVACSLADYLNLYQTRQADLLNRRGGVMNDHPAAVTNTLRLSFQKLEQASPVAAELLLFCAFVHPDAIPEELFALGAAELSPVLQAMVTDPLALNAAIGEMLKWSLVQRDPNSKTLSVHRLTQVVLKDGMDEAARRQWAECAVRVVYQALPNPRFSTSWETCQRLLPHAQACAELIKQWDFHFAEAIQLLNRAGYYLKRRGMYGESAILHEQALAIVQQFTDVEPLVVADTLDGLGILYYHQAKYTEAEPLYQQALAIREQELGEEHPDVALTLHRLALLYDEKGAYVGRNTEAGRQLKARAEPLYLQALAIQKKVLGPEHPDFAECLNNLGSLYLYQGKYAEAEPLFLRALAIREKALGESPDLILSLGFLARLYVFQGKYTEAEPLLQRVLQMCQRILGAEHEYMATTLSSLGDTYSGLGRYTEAEQCYHRAIEIREKALGREHHQVASVLSNYAALLRATQREEEAESLEERARAILAASA